MEPCPAPGRGRSGALHGGVGLGPGLWLQFLVASYASEAPVDPAAIERYLGSGLIRGIGPSFARRIVALFGKSTLDVIDQNPLRLQEVPGLGAKQKR